MKTYNCLQALHDRFFSRAGRRMTKRVRPALPHQRQRPMLESLEDRTAPAFLAPVGWSGSAFVTATRNAGPQGEAVTVTRSGVLFGSNAEHVLIPHGNVNIQAQAGAYFPNRTFSLSAIAAFPNDPQSSGSAFASATLTLHYGIVAGFGEQVGDPVSLHVEVASFSRGGGEFAPTVAVAGAAIGPGDFEARIGDSLTISANVEAAVTKPGSGYVEGAFILMHSVGFVDVLVQASPNRPPEFKSIGTPFVAEGSTLSVNASAADPNPGQILTYSLVSGPPGASINSATGTITYPALDGPASFPVTVRVTDNGTPSLSDEESFTITVNNVAPGNLSLTPSRPAIDEHDTVTLDGRFLDPGVLDSHTVSIDWGDGSSDVIPLAANVLAFTTSHRYLDNLPGNAPYTIAVTVTDKDGASGHASVPLSVVNVPPRFDVIFLPPGQVDEGDTVAVSGFFSDPGTLDSHDVRVIWGDGRIDAFNLAAGEFSFLAVRQFLQNAPGDAPYLFRVVVSDKDGGAEASIPYEYVVRNVRPVARIGGPPAAAVQHPVTFTLGATDKGPVDQAANFTYRVDWTGDGSVDETVSGPAQMQVSHVFLTPGVHNVRVSATDIDGGASAVVSHPITVHQAVFVGDNVNIGGTVGDDTIVVRRDNSGGIVVTVNGGNVPNPAGGNTFPMPPTGRVIVYGGTGDDNLLAVGAVPLEAHGGAGNDTVHGGAADDVLWGDAGDDFIFGMLGNDVLIGGSGRDRLFAMAGADILIGGELRGGRRHNDTAEYDYDTLRAIGAAWVAGVADPDLDSGLADDLEDAEEDTLIGGAGRDWFLGNLTGFDADHLPGYSLSADKRTSL